MKVFDYEIIRCSTDVVLIRGHSKRMHNRVLINPELCLDDEFPTLKCQTLSSFNVEGLALKIRDPDTNEIIEDIGDYHNIRDLKKAKRLSERLKRPKKKKLPTLFWKICIFLSLIPIVAFQILFFQIEITKDDDPISIGLGWLLFTAFTFGILFHCIDKKNDY